MANPGRRSSKGSGFPLSVPLPPCRGGVPSRPQQLAIPQFIIQGSHESFEGDGEIGVDFQRRRVRPPTRFGGRESQEVVGDESDEDVHAWRLVWYISFTFESLESRASCWISFIHYTLRRSTSTVTRRNNLCSWPDHGRLISCLSTLVVRLD
jgi:hypothetical protein